MLFTVDRFVGSGDIIGKRSGRAKNNTMAIWNDEDLSLLKKGIKYFMWASSRVLITGQNLLFFTGM